MALITRRQFVQQTAFSAGALRGLPFKMAKAGEKPTAIDSAAIRRLVSKIAGHVITPDASDYESARQVNNHAYDRHPALIVLCTSPADVARSLDFGRSQNLTVAVRCGGHSAAGFGGCNGGVVIDLARMKRVEVDVHKRVAHAEAGCVIGDVDQETQRFGLATPLRGAISRVGVSDSAFVLRQPGYEIDITGLWSTPAERPKRCDGWRLRGTVCGRLRTECT